MSTSPGGRLRSRVTRLRSGLEGLAVSGDSAWRRVFEELDRIESGVGLLEDVAQDSFGAYEHSVRDLSVLRAVHGLVVQSFDEERLCSGFLEVLDRELPCHASALDLERGSGPRTVRGSWDPELDGALADAARARAREEGVLDFHGPDGHPELGPLGEAAGRQSVFVCPVEALGRPYAVLHRFDCEPGRFQREEIRITRAVCDLLGLALRHVALSEQQVCGPLPVPRADSALLSLARQEKFFALDRLAASVAHELNNPMSYVLSNVSRAREYVETIAQVLGVPGAEPVGPPASADELPTLLADFRSLLDETEGGLARMRTVAKRLHDVGGHSSKPAGLVDLNEIVETSLGMARSDTKCTIHFELALKPLPPVMGRRFDLVHAMFNLLSNAIEAVGSEGVVRVASGRAGDQARVEVIDDGPPVKESNPERLFEPFHTHKGESHAGLGLPIARGIARAHGGDVSLVFGADTVATLTLPLAEARR
ncbi:MAG: ATP-binding protein [Myxococcota bacterium]|nr:ATP-binding protein [Myxococcota bacterium]